MVEIKINNRKYYELICEKCNINFKRRKDEFQKKLDKSDNQILCCDCMKAKKYESKKTRMCSKCKKEKNIEEFYKKKKSGRSYCSQCKECMNDNNKRYRETHKEEQILRQKQYRSNNKEKVTLRSKAWKDKNKDLVRQYRRNGYHKNKNDKFYKLKIQTRNLIFKAFERKGYKKGSKSEEILGCDYEIFIQHLLQTYINNYGYEWDGKEPIHIDHKKPLSAAQTEEEVIKLNHYSNLQLLKTEDNLKKSNKLNWKLKEEII